MARDHILAIDQGTTSTRVVVYNDRLRPVGSAQVEVTPSFPRPGWVEHDPAALVASATTLIPKAVENARLSDDRIACLGITNQRETTVVWDRATGTPIYPAIVWQDRRTADKCRDLAEHAGRIAELTGLVVDPYFSATKIDWILDNVPGAREKAAAGGLAAGTVDSYLLWCLTKGSIHATDVTNASRTSLMDLRGREWSDELCGIFNVPRAIMPRIVPSYGTFGTTTGLESGFNGIPICGIAGDQHASLIGHGCVTAGRAKCTYGTGAFLLVHTGSKPVRSRHGLLTTLAASAEGSEAAYALEGSVFTAGAAVQWFRDGLKAIGNAPMIDQLSLEANADSELIFVPALVGLGAPHWCPEARGTIFGVTRGTSVADLARATLEGIAFETADLLAAAAADLGAPIDELRVDGGLARSDPFLQYQGDLLGVSIRRGAETESTALGAALLAAVGVGLLSDLETAVKTLETGGRVFSPRIDAATRERKIDRWRHAVETVVRHYQK